MYNTYLELDNLHVQAVLAPNKQIEYNPLTMFVEGASIIASIQL